MMNTAMSNPSNDSTAAVARAARELAQLHQQVDQVRKVLSGLKQSLIEAESQLDSSRAAQLVAANEHLMQVALQAHIHVDSVEQALQQVSEAAQLDVLTRLPNRIVLFNHFAQAAAMADRSGQRVAILFIDLDNFKQINDTLGHAAGDEVLKLMAHCLSSSVRKADTVCRHGGDEFLILLPELPDVTAAVRIADKVIAALATPQHVGEHVLRLAASIGISIYPDDGADADTLIDRADAAMYRAKRRSPGSFAVHGSDMADEPAVRTPAAPPRADYDALPEATQRQACLRDANEHLVESALHAQDSQAAAEQAQRKQTEFLAQVAHELRAPLTPIRLAASLIMDVDAKELPRMQAIIDSQLTHMTRLVTDLLDVSRINTGKLRIERRRIDLLVSLDAAIEICRPAINLRSQHFQVRFPTVAVEVDGDPVRLTQVVCNLLTNASKYTPEGGQIMLQLETTADAAVITLSDDGIGISAGVLPEVFKPFVQDTHAVAFNGTGLGIGLTVVRELVEAHGGSVVASSGGAGCGSQFVVSLPLAQADDPRPAAADRMPGACSVEP